MYSFEDLQIINNIPRNHFFKYLQIRSYILKKHQSARRPPLSNLEKAIMDNLQGRGQVSLLYHFFVDNSEESSNSKRLEWSHDLSREISEVDWKTVCQTAQTQTINTRFKLIQFKWIMCTYITPYLPPA